eukprot:GHRR01001643.1.p5 GENE.GHRR01001643.1~~GHRR01001643.1.p5  ORF type:complete len:103 (+),score=34.68 GHRR01001643.1:2638-2946(+)
MDLSMGACTTDTGRNGACTAAGTSIWLVVGTVLISADWKRHKGNAGASKSKHLSPPCNTQAKLYLQTDSCDTLSLVEHTSAQQHIPGNMQLHSNCMMQQSTT